MLQNIAHEYTVILMSVSSLHADTVFVQVSQLVDYLDTLITSPDNPVGWIKPVSEVFSIMSGLQVSDKFFL